MPRIYLDNAATSWPKPESVYQAVEQTQRQLGASFGRGAYREATEAQRLIEQTRHEVAKFINASGPQNIAFTYSGTDALSTAIFGLLNGIPERTPHVVTSTAEHNSVLRPLRHLENQNRVTVTHVDCDATGQFKAVDILNAIRSDTRLVVLTQVSNVTGAIQPLAEIGQHCHENKIDYLIDAAQSIGHLPIDVRELNCDLLTASGHKGLLGPLGTGILYFTDRIAKQLTPLRFGGTGSISIEDTLPTKWPEKFEAGNLNVSGIIGLGAGIKFLTSPAGRQLQSLEHELTQQFLNGLSKIEHDSKRVTLYGPRDMLQRTGVFSFTFAELSCHDAAAVLDTNWSIQTRAGFHCAPRLHHAIGTAGQGGTVRISLGLFNTVEQIEMVLEALNEMVS